MARMCLMTMLMVTALFVPSYSFFFSSRSKSPAQQWFGIRDYGVGAQSPYSYDTTGAVSVAVPVAVPLPPHQVSPPYPGLTSVQLVPCLCPISKDPELLKPHPTPASQSAMSTMMQTSAPTQQ